MPETWAEGLREAVASEVATHHEDTNAERELLTIDSRHATLDQNLEDWQEVMDLALRFSTRCATAYRRGGDRTRRLFNAAVLAQVNVRDGHVVEAAYKEPFDLLFSSPKFEYGDEPVGATGLEPVTSAV